MLRVLRNTSSVPSLDSIACRRRLTAEGVIESERAASVKEADRASSRKKAKSEGRVIGRNSDFYCRVEASSAR